MDFATIMEDVARVFEAVGVLVLVCGGVWAFYRAIGNYRAHRDVYTGVRSDFGRALLLGLEVLVAADIVKTVSVATTLENVVILGILVLVRTLLSFSLDVEIEGVVPWRRAFAGITQSGARQEDESAAPTATAQDGGNGSATRA